MLYVAEWVTILLATFVLEYYITARCISIYAAFDINLTQAAVIREE